MEDSSSAAMGIMPSVDPMGAVDAVVGALAAKWGVARDRKSVGAHLKRRVSARVGRVLANFSAGVKRRVPAEGVSEGLCADLLIGGFPSAMSGIDGSRYLLASIGSSIAGGRKGKDDDKAGERDAKSTKSASGTTADAESNGPVDSSETSDGDGDVVDESIEDKAGQQCGSEAKGQGEPSVSPSAMAGSVSSLGGSGQGASSAADAGSGDASQTQERILISEIEVKGASPELRTVANQSLVMKPNFAYTLKEVQEDVNRVFSTGYFSSCHPVAEDTRDGVRLTIEVKENPKLTGVVATGADMLPQSLIEEAFEDQVRTPPTPIQFSTHSPSILPSLQSGSGTRADDSRPLLLTRAHPNSVASLSLSRLNHGTLLVTSQYGKTLNFENFGRALGQLNKWYEVKGIFGQVTDADMKGNVAELRMKEARISRVSLKFLNPETGEQCMGAFESHPRCIRSTLSLTHSLTASRRSSLIPRAAPSSGKTSPEVIMKNMTIKPGQVYNVRQAKSDIDVVHAMGLFDDVNIVPQPAEDTTQNSDQPKIHLTLNVVERKTGVSPKSHSLVAHRIR